MIARFPPRLSPNPEPAVLRAATYNLLHGLSVRTGRVDLEAAAATIAAFDADVVALQEVDRGQPRSGGEDQLAVLAELVGRHAAFAPALFGDPDRAWRAARGRDRGGPAYGVGLLSTRPLAAVRRVTLPGGGDGWRKAGASPQNAGWDREPRVALSAELAVDGRTVQVTATHLSYLPWRGLAQLRAAASVAPRNVPAVLLGDLNLPVWPVRLVLARRWTHPGGEPTYPAWRPRVQVDQILVAGGVEVRGVVVGPPAMSDHRPVVATLALR